MAGKFAKLPSIAGLTDRPAPIRSGKPLKQRVKICYRSDLYMKEQKKNVINFQEQLRQALADLKTAKPDSVQFHADRVEELKVKADDMIILLQVCGKINRELTYARKELMSAVEKGAESQLINRKRKRVQWLENKLEEIIIKHSPARKDEVADDGQSDVDMLHYSDMGNNSINNKSPMSSFPADMSRLPTADSDGRLNTAATSASQLHVSVSRVNTEEVIGAQQSGNRLILPEEASAADEKAMSPTPNLPKTSQSKLSFREPLESGLQSSSRFPTTSQFEEHGEDSLDYDDDEYADEDGDDENSDAEFGSRTDNKSAISVVSSLFTDVTDEGARRTRRSSRRLDPQSSKSLLSKDHLTRDVSRVTVKSPEPDETETEPARANDLLSSDCSDICSLSSMSIDSLPLGADEEAAEDYWQSEHHRVEFSALRPYLHELDPNSLHQVGIAVPGNYVDRPPPGRSVELPWREAEDNRDINSAMAFHEHIQLREALDRLSKQLIQMQDKVYEAAIKSVDSMGNGISTRMSKRDFSSHPKAADRSAMSSRPFTQKTATSLPALQEQQDDSQNRFTPLIHLKYYSKEIPKAKALPISRVKREKCYPQSISSFVFPDPDGRPAPPRLVNQGSLYTDTKLVIYKAPNRKRMDFAEESKKAVGTQSQPTLETEKTGTSTNISLRAASKAAMAFGALKSENTTPNISDDAVKVEPARAAHVGLKWDRIQYLFQTSLKSKYVEERQNAAKQLGLLGCADPEVFEALKAAIVNDTDERVQYESAKALIRLGCLEDELIQILVDYLIVGNEEVRLDMLKTLSQAKGITYINKAMPSFDELIKVLAHLCKNLNVDDPVAFDAAIAFGTICVKNMQAVEKMSHYLNHGTDTHKKAVALRILIKQFNEWSWNLVEVVLKQFTNSPVWMYRKEAAQLLQHLGRKHTCKTSEQEELVYSILERRLWDDSVEMVRMEAAHTLGVLDMYPRAAETVVRRLSDLDPTIRAHAVTSLGTLGIKQPKVLRMLTEMLELDPSDNVRREVIRAFGSLQVTDKKIIRLIKERERGEGILAAEAKQVLRVLEAL